VVAEQLKVGDAKVLAGLAQFGEPGQCDTRPVVAFFAWLGAGRTISELAIGAGDDDCPDALVRIRRQDATGA
jgi:hypothetical protein